MTWLSEGADSLLPSWEDKEAPEKWEGDSAGSQGKSLGKCSLPHTALCHWEPHWHTCVNDPIYRPDF